MEFFLERTQQEFNQAGTRLNWGWSKSFSEFENVLGDGYHTTWLEVLTNHFPEPLENKPKATRELKHCDKKENIYCAISIFICEILGDQKPCDWQYIYMKPGGDYPFQKDLMTSLQMHARQFKEMLQITKALPAGNWSKPSEALALEWFYMSFHKNNRNKFVTAGRKLDTKTFKLVTEFFEAQFTTNKNNGMLECMELEHIKKRAQLKLKKELCNKIRAHEDERCTYQARGEIAFWDTRRRPYNDCKERCQCIDCNCNRDHADSKERQAVKRPRIKHSGYHNRKDYHHDNQPEKLGYEKPKSNSKVLCPIHSFPDKLAKHSWAKCSKNPANQRKPAPQLVVNAHHTAIDNRYLSNDDHSPMELDHTKAANNQSLDCCSFSNYNDHAFVTFEAPPPPARKKGAEKVKHNNKLAKNKKKTITSSNNNNKDMGCTQPYAALAKGLDKPLVFSSESN
jgi:hypothetical protein